MSNTDDVIATLRSPYSLMITSLPLHAAYLRQLIIQDTHPPSVLSLRYQCNMKEHEGT